MKIINQNRKAVRFLLVFIGLYFILNTLYGLYIQYYYPGSDFFTRAVTHQVAWLLSFFDSSVTYYPSSMNEYIPIGNDRENLIDVFEGCNGLNVMIVYISFLIAFVGPLSKLVRFALIGFIAIHLINLLRIAMLYGVAFYFPDQLYFFHRYLFTGIIYVMVFVLWFYWVKAVKNNESS